MKATEILIVEDVVVFAKQVKLRLESKGYSVIGIVDNGPDAIKFAEDKNPDIILMDITLNGTMTGLDAAREIVKSKRIPIIFLTANSDKSILESGRKISKNSVFTKPFSDNELHMAIQQVIISNAMASMLDKD
ncbi:MAG: response regulator [Candidatus Marinimicrobia bacterium]|nr:response regulator [Candidatus Neomarinimicrobiota bacterium]